MTRLSMPCAVAVLLAILANTALAQAPQAIAPADRWRDRPLPDVKLTDTDGKEITWQNFKDKPLALLLASSSCPACKRTAEKLLARLAKEADLIAVVLILDAEQPSGAGPTPKMAAREFRNAIIGDSPNGSRFVVATADNMARSSLGSLLAVNSLPIQQVPVLVHVNKAGRVENATQGEPE